MTDAGLFAALLVMYALGVALGALVMWWRLRALGQWADYKIQERDEIIRRRDEIIVALDRERADLRERLQAARIR